MTGNNFIFYGTYFLICRMSSPEEDAAPYALDENGNLAVPPIMMTDYIEMIVLVFLLLFGIPLNGFVLKRLIQAWNDGTNLNRHKVSLIGLDLAYALFLAGRSPIHLPLAQDTTDSCGPHINPMLLSKQTYLVNQLSMVLW